MDRAREAPIRSLDGVEIGVLGEAEQPEGREPAVIEGADGSAALGGDALDVERADATQEVEERDQPEPRRARERPDLIEPAGMRHRGDHPPVGLVAGLGDELGADREPDPGELAHDGLGERAIELLLEVGARPGREAELVLHARRRAGHTALEDAADLVLGDEPGEPGDQRALRELALGQHRRATPQHEQLGTAGARRQREDAAGTLPAEPVQEAHELASGEPASQRSFGVSRHGAIFGATVPRGQFFYPPTPSRIT